MTHYVFSSHSSKDKAIADAVCASLEAAKIRCWIAPRDILPGDKSAGAITKAKESSHICLNLNLCPGRLMIARLGGTEEKIKERY